VVVVVTRVDVADLFVYTVAIATLVVLALSW